METDNLCTESRISSSDELERRRIRARRGAQQQHNNRLTRVNEGKTGLLCLQKGGKAVIPLCIENTMCTLRDPRVRELHSCYHKG